MKADNNNFDVRKTILDNGLVIVSEKMAHVRSVSLGIFLRSGSRHENIARHGLTHFIEHALFKGTMKRSAAQIAAESDAIGGYLDAFTGREIVGYYDKVLDENLHRSFELIADLTLNPAFDQTELEKERNVILEEIKMVEDTPDDVIFDIFIENFYPSNSLGRPILGTPETLATFDAARVRSYYEEIYTPANFVITAAGNLEHERVVELVNKYFGGLKPAGPSLDYPLPESSAQIVLRDRSELEQSHLVMGWPSPSMTSADRYAANLLNMILGGGMSSRLFQSVREDRGLVYNIYSSTTPFKDCGYLSIYAAASTDQFPETIETTISEIDLIKKEMVSEEEMQRNREQLKTSLIFNLESSSSRMSSLAQQEISFGRFISADEIIKNVQAISAEDVRRVANDIFKPEALGVTVIGDLDGFTLEREQLIKGDYSAY